MQRASGDDEVTVVPDSVEVDGRVNRRVQASLPIEERDARLVACGEETPPGTAEGDANGDEVYGSDTFDGTVLESESCRKPDDREFPVVGGAATTVDDLDADDVQLVMTPPPAPDGSMALFGRVARISTREDAILTGEDSEPEKITHQKVWLAGDNGTTVVDLDGKYDAPTLRQGDQVVMFDLNIVEEDGGPPCEQTEDSTVVVIGNSEKPEGYWLERESALVNAKYWYKSEDNDYEAENIVKNTILEENHIETPRGQDDKMWMFVDNEADEDHGLFTPHGEDHIRELLDEHLPEWKNNQRTKNSIVASLIDRTRVPADRFEGGAPDDERLRWSVGVENGVIDLRTGELHDHGPEWRLLDKLPVTFDPDAPAELGPELQWFIEDTMKEDADRESFRYLVGHALARCYPDEATWTVIGPGKNGKTILSLVLEELFGSASGDFELGAIAGDNDFGTGSLVGNNIVVDDDATGVKLHDSTTFKRHTGGRSAEVNVKNEQRTSYDNYATLLMLSNNPPVFSDKTPGLKRRVYPVIMPNRYTNDPTDDHEDAVPKEELLDRLTSEEELQRLLAVAVEYAGRIHEHGVEDGRTEDERWGLYENYSDSILRFWQECMTEESGARVTRSAVFETYVQWANANGVDPVSPGGRNGFWPLSQECHAVSFNTDVWLDGDRAVEHVQFDPDALDHAPGWVADKWEADIDEDETTLANRLDRPTPLADLSGGYCSVEARVIARDYADAMEEAGVKITLEDDTTAIDAVSWDGEFDGVDVGDKVRLERAVLTQHRSVPQLKFAGPTAVEVVERGPLADVPGEDALAADGGEDTDSTGTRNTALDDHDMGDVKSAEAEIKTVVDDRETDHDDGVPRKDVIDAVVDREDADRETVEHAADKLKRKGEIYDPKSGHWRTT